MLLKMQQVDDSTTSFRKIDRLASLVTRDFAICDIEVAQAANDATDAARRLKRDLPRKWGFAATLATTPPLRGTE